nr:hypothetical protein StreXyl84_69860 [Streptomyces sp. Xyl84]
MAIRRVRRACGAQLLEVAPFLTERPAGNAAIAGAGASARSVTAAGATAVTAAGTGARKPGPGIAGLRVTG